MNHPDKISVSILDDHPVVLNGLQKMLDELSGYITLYDVCDTEQKLAEALRKRRPDVLLLDIQMPGRKGDELAREISRKYPLIAILVFTNLDQTFHIRNLFLNGAKGYLLKAVSSPVLLQAIQTVHKGEQYIDPALRQQMRQDMAEQRAGANGIPRLTKREKEILVLISNELTSQEIAQKLFITPSAVENHRLNLLFKLNVKNSVGLIKKAIHLGLVR